MWWTAAIQAGVSLFGAAASRSAARQARRISGMNVRASQAETRETLRRMRAEDRVQEGRARSIVGASGLSLQAGTSQHAYISEMIKENIRQREFVRKSGEREAQILRAGGQLAYRQGRAESIGNLASGIASAGEMWQLGKEQQWKLPWSN